ncbi:hypothetical protein [Herbidospora cretacea]|uniref:hypothetical protein n=1 Tax=Herbidospora cretacea TaxID=28444 RepID=UPI0007747217|nr:hypothetical protein [Herbidospora cretacea]
MVEHDLTAPDPARRAQALRRLARHGDATDAEAVAALIADPGEFDDRDDLNDPDESARTPVRMVALEALASLAAPGTHAGEFDRALHDADLRVRAAATLGASAGALRARLPMEADRGVRYRIALALLPGDESAYAILRDLSTGEDLPAQAAAVILGAVPEA